MLIEYLWALSLHAWRESHIDWHLQTILLGMLCQPLVMPLSLMTENVDPFYNLEQFP